MFDLRPDPGGDQPSIVAGTPFGAAGFQPGRVCASRRWMPLKVGVRAILGAAGDSGRRGVNLVSKAGGPTWGAVAARVQAGLTHYSRFQGH